MNIYDPERSWEGRIPPKSTSLSLFYPSPERILVALCFFVKTITICVVKRNLKQIIVRIVSLVFERIADFKVRGVR